MEPGVPGGFVLQTLLNWAIIGTVLFGGVWMVRRLRRSKSGRTALRILLTLLLIAFCILVFFYIQLAQTDWSK